MSVAPNTHSFVAHEGWINSLAFGPKQTLWSAGTDRTARAHEIANQQASEAEQPSRRINCMAIAPRGDEYALGYQELAASARSRLLAAHPELDAPAVSTNQVRVVAGTNSPAVAVPAK